LLNQFCGGDPDLLYRAFVTHVRHEYNCQSYQAICIL